MKATIVQRVAGARLRDAVPPPYRTAIVKSARNDAEYSLILCAHAERDVVSSSELAQAFRRLGPPASGGTFVVGTVFTEEATALAQEHGAQVIALRTSKWTDESARQRQR